MTDLATPPLARSGALDDLRALLPGQVLTPDDPQWETQRLGWVVNVDQRPAAVVTIGDVEDVVAVVTCAARHGLVVSAQPVGHGATTALTDTVLLRTGALQDLDVDAERRVVRVGAGVKWGAVLHAVEPTGFIVPTGSSPDPSVVGFTLGGGLSWFSRAVGLAAQHVVSFEVVDATGTPRRVTETSDPDLFWAMRGGGGDYAVVTAMELRLLDAGPIQGGRMMWPIEMAWPVLRAYRTMTASAPEALTAWAHLFRFPPLEMVPEPIRGKAFVTVDLTFLGSAEELDGLLAPFRELPAMTIDTVGPVPLSAVGDIAAEPVDPMPTLEMSGLLHDLDEAALDGLLGAAGAEADVPLAVVQIRHLGGALRRALPGDGPHGPVEEGYQLFALGVPMAPGMAVGIAHAFEAITAGVSGQLTGRSLFNFRGSHSDASTCFTATALDRLRAVKEAVDPAGVLRGNRPIQP